MKKITGILLCLSMIAGMFGTTAQASAPHEPPEGDQWRLVRVLDFEQPDFSVNQQLQASPAATNIRGSNATLTGQYLSYEATAAYSGFTLPLGSDLNGDILAVKFKLYINNMSNAGGFDIALQDGVNQVAVIGFWADGKVMRYNDGRGGAGVPAAFDNSMTWNVGWNDIEVRLLKEGGANYVSAEYYLNGTKGETPGKTVRSNTQPQINSLLIYNNNGDPRERSYIDDIYIYDTKEDIFEKLDEPADVNVNPGGVVSFSEVAGAKAYSIKLYKNGNLASVVTRVPGDENLWADFSSDIKSDLNGAYTFSVQAKGDYNISKNSNEVFVNDWTMPSGIPGQPGTPEWNGTVLSWGAAESAGTYTVRLYKDGAVAKTVNGIIGTSFDFNNYMSIYGDGEYSADTFTGNIKGNGAVSSRSGTFSYVLEDHRQTEYLWNFEPPAYIAETNLSKIKTYSATVRGQSGGSEGQYISVERISAGNDGYPFAFPAINSDVASVKLRVNPASSESARINVTSMAGLIASMTFAGGDVKFNNGSTDVSLGLTYEAGNWNNVEIRLIKGESGAGNPYVRAEYYVNGKKGNTGSKSSLNSETRTSVSGISVQAVIGEHNLICVDEIYLDNFMPPLKDAEIVENQIAGMTFPDIIVDDDNLDMPLSYNGAVKVIWSSDKPELISSNGVINRPIYSGEAEVTVPVTLTVTVTKGAQSATKQFTLNVLKKSVAGNLAETSHRKWTKANSIFDMDLIEPKRLNCIVLKGLSKNVRGIKLQYSEDGTDYKTLHTSQSSVESVVKLAAPVTARYLRLVILDIDGGTVTLGALEACLFLSFEDMLSEALDAVSLDNISRITKDISLPLSSLHGSTISWTSDKPEVIEIVSSTGKVKQPTSSKVIVNLIATVSMEGTALTKSGVFAATVLPLSSGSNSQSSGTLRSGGGGGGLVKTPVPVPIQNVPDTSSSSDFTDIKGHWAEDHIKELKEKGVVNGNTSGEFYPDALITRAELLAMVVRALNLPLEKYAGAFTDVTADDWYSDVIQAGLSAGLISKDVSFRPNDGITREEMCKIIVSASKMLTNLSVDVSEGYSLSYTDSFAFSDWAVDYVKAASYYGLMSGMEDGSFAPQSGAVRAQAATVINRLLK